MSTAAPMSAVVALFGEFPVICEVAEAVTATAGSALSAVGMTVIVAVPLPGLARSRTRKLVKPARSISQARDWLAASTPLVFSATNESERTACTANHVPEPSSASNARLRPAP